MFWDYNINGSGSVFQNFITTKHNSLISITFLQIAEQVSEWDRREKMEERSEMDKIDDVMLPGFRFHPTDEELVDFYLRRKIQQKTLPIELIKQVDIYKYDPWDLPSKELSHLSSFLYPSSLYLSSYWIWYVCFGTRRASE